MIPYDDLVVALTAWRARQGLPVAPAAAVAAPAPSAPAVTAAPSRGRAEPPRPAPAPAPAPARLTPARTIAVESNDFEDGALVEDGYDAGEDYVLQLGDPPAEATAVGSAPDPAANGRRDKRW